MREMMQSKGKSTAAIEVIFQEYISDDMLLFCHTVNGRVTRKLMSMNATPEAGRHSGAEVSCYAQVQPHYQFDNC
jgi:hypothetical protein